MGLREYDVTSFIIYCDELLTSKDKSLKQKKNFCQFSGTKNKRQKKITWRHLPTIPPRDRFEMKIENSQNTVNMNVE